ncbi:hypothetical protein PINS_up005474 [Pythium insidiosum]|nr:hypothetical protein PINS_up005474 [Pythium insidiosum]
MASRSGPARVSSAAVARISPAAPVLFLDVDGVLNVQQQTLGQTPRQQQRRDGGFTRLHASLVARLAVVIRQTRARVVLSSSWRFDAQRRAQLQRLWRRERLPPIDDETPSVALSVTGADGTDANAVQRVDEILAWVEAHKATQWAALDDLDLAAAATAMGRDSSVAARFVRTHPHRGLQQGDCEALVALFGEAAEPIEWQPWSSAVESIQDRADLLVVWSPREDTMVVLSTSDFCEETRFRGSETSLRQWLMELPDNISMHRVVGVVLMTPDDSSHDLDPSLSLLLPELVVNVAVESAAHSVSDFVTALMAVTTSSSIDVSAESIAARALDAVCSRLAAHDAASFCADAASERLMAIGFTARHVGLFLSNESFASQLLDSLSVLSSRTSASVMLAVEITRRFRGERHQRLRRHLVECVERRELTTTDALTAVQSWASLACDPTDRALYFRNLEQTLLLFRREDNDDDCSSDMA